MVFFFSAARAISADRLSDAFRQRFTGSQPNRRHATGASGAMTFSTAAKGAVQ